MAVSTLTCPTCSAPLIVAANATRIQCRYCDSALVINQSQGETYLALASTLVADNTKTRAAIEAGAHMTQAELRRLHLGQELAHLKTRLTALNSEIRTLQRAASSAVAKRQLREVHAERALVEEEMQRLEAQLSPVEGGATTPRSLAAAADTRPTWRRIASLLLAPTGRISQMHYLVGAAILLVPFLFLGSLASDASERAAGDENSLLGFLVLLIIYSYMTIAIKRYHDLGKSGWWAAIAFIPFGVFYQWYELLFRPSVPGANEFGSMPPQEIGSLIAPSRPNVNAEGNSTS